MVWLLIFGILLMMFLMGLYILYRLVFGRNPKSMDDDFAFPRGKQYDLYRETILQSVKQVLALPYERVEILSRDGISLVGRYFKGEEGKPLVLFFHGYRCTGMRDGNGILQFCQRNGYHTLVVTQRAHGGSEGRTITFGVKERYDCLDWISDCTKRFGTEQKIVLAGLSMGASTVLMSTGLKLPAQVKGVIADCPYSSPKEILRAVIRQMHYPEGITYALVRLSGKLFGGFDVEDYTALEAMKGCEIPVLLIHGDEDLFVPCTMSQDCYDICRAKSKELLMVPKAGHGVCYCADARSYERALERFFEKIS